MRTNPDDRQADHTEDDIGDELRGCHARIRGYRIGDMGLEARVPREEDEVNAFAADPSREAIPVVIGQSVSFDTFVFGLQTRLEQMC